MTSDGNELRSDAYALLYSSAKALDEYRDDVDQDIQYRLETAVQALEDALKGEDAAEIRRCMTVLDEEVQIFGDRSYEDLQQEASSADMEQDVSMSINAQKDPAQDTPKP